jgi:predicted  nucleic acid-binding Zn-ribbon protein
MGQIYAKGEALMSENGLEISESRQRRIEVGLLAVQQVEQERDACQEALANLQTEHRGLKAEHDALSLAYERAQNDITTWRQDRDEAVSKLAAFQAVFDAVLAVMQKHRGATQEDSATNLKPNPAMKVTSG